MRDLGPRPCHDLQIGKMDILYAVITPDPHFVLEL